MNGEFFEYYKEGNGIKTKGFYKNGKKTGTWTYYTTAGKVESTAKYKEGKKL
jgi:antitoxin component YwqK of YwqJK toxin-antitoxin module